MLRVSYLIILTMMVFVLGLVMSVGLTAFILWVLRRGDHRHQVREDTPSGHQRKQGTPSMGGIGMVLAVVLISLGVWIGFGIFWRTTGRQVLAILAVTLIFAGLGLADDYRKLSRQTSTGLKARYRISIELIAAAAFSWLVITHAPPLGENVAALGFSSLPPIARIILGTLVVVGSANAVNLTDGLDGLAAGLVALCAGSLIVVCWALGYLELALLSALVAGVSAGFLWFNAYPAQIFMGDVGSLGLGAVLGAIAVVARVELLFAVLAGVFVIETLSVIIQVACFKTTGKRVFLMSPIHHSLELRGWSEPQIVTRLWLAGALCAAVGLIIAVSVVG